MSQGNGTAAEILKPYIECPDCAGRGYVKVRVDAETRLLLKDPEQKTIIRDHERCSGAGILILRRSVRGGEPYYGRPKLS